MPWLLLLALILFTARAEIEQAEALLFLDFSDERRVEFSEPTEHLEITNRVSLHGLQAMSVGGWFYPRRRGEQAFFFRGLPQTAPSGDRLFKPEPNWVNFLLGMDERGFLMGAINGNSIMPFLQVTVNEVQFGAWSQCVIVKETNGFHSFYLNGTLVHRDNNGLAAGKAWPFVDTAHGKPMRLAMPRGGLIGEAWIFGRELQASEIRADFERKRAKYDPAHATERVLLREMNQHNAAGLWKTNLSAQNWPVERARISNRMAEIFGQAPIQKPPLEARVHEEVDCGSYLRRKVSIQVEPGERAPAYLLLPKKPRAERLPAIICFYGTTSGAGKDTTVGLSGRSPGSKPHPNLAFAVDLAEAGFVACAPDYLRDGERVKQGERPYDTSDFYRRHPDWSIHGKDAWDTSRVIDYLQTLPFVDGEKIGMTGHSYGGHSTIFTTALEPRIKAAVASGPVSDFLHHGMHWAVPKGGGNSQSLPAMRPYVLDHTRAQPFTFYEITALAAPRPLLVAQAAGERRPNEEENYAAVHKVYDALGAPERVKYLWHAGDHDFPPELRGAAVAWFKQWLWPQ